MIRIPVRAATCAGLALLGWAGALLGDGSDQWLTMILLLWATGGVVLAYPLLRSVKFTVPGRGRRTVSATYVRRDHFTAFWLWVEEHVPKIRSIREQYADRLRAMGAGLTYDYDMHARRATHLALTLAPLVTIPLVSGEIMLAPAAAAPAVFVYPMMQLWSRVRQHAVQVTEEMSFFLSYLTTMQGVGYTLYKALDMVRDASDVFIAMSRDAANVTRKVTLGTPHMDALREYAAAHPVPAFKDFLHGYISKHETVGSSPAYTESKAEQFFEAYTQTWKRYKESAFMMATMAVTMCVMIPVMMVMMVFIASPATVNTIFMLGPLLGPVFAMVLLFMVQSGQPSTGVTMKPWLPSIGVGVATAIVLQMLWMSQVPDGDIWKTEPGLTISLGFVAAGLSNYMMVRKQIAGSSNVDRGLPEFLNDIMEQTRAGTSMTAILRQQARSKIYSGKFRHLLRGIVARLEAGSTMEDACREARGHSRYLSFVLFTIMRLHEIGSASPNIIQQMSRFMSGIVTTKMDVVKSLRMGAMMIYVAPLMLLGIAHGMFMVVDTDTSSLESLAAVLPPGVMDSFGPPDPSLGYEQRLGVLAALITCPMGLVAAKISKFTAVDTMPLVIVASINAATIVMLPLVMDAMQL